MKGLNYHHLRYFWMTAREGSLRRAAEKLHVSQPSMSAQIKSLEESLGEALFRKEGRGLALTRAGEKAYAMASEIFELGDELLEAIREEQGPRAMRLNVGITDVLPKSVAHVILKEALDGPAPFRLMVREGPMEDVLGMLQAGRLDMVLANEPAPSGSGFHMHNHFLGECGVTFMAEAQHAKRLQQGFPHSLHGEKALLPTAHAPLRRRLDRWFYTEGIEPVVAAEFDDPALMKVFGAHSGGFLPVPSWVTTETRGRHGLCEIGSTEEVRESFYAITPEKRVAHPGVSRVLFQRKDFLNKAPTPPPRAE